jgi:hypothetical protein
LAVGAVADGQDGAVIAAAQDAIEGVQTDAAAVLFATMAAEARGLENGANVVGVREVGPRGRRRQPAQIDFGRGGEGEADDQAGEEAARHWGNVSHAMKLWDDRLIFGKRTF